MSGNLNRSSSYGHTVISTGWRVLAMPIIQASSACYDRMRSQNEDRIRTRFSCVRSQKGELILEFPREKSRNGDLILEILGIRSRIWDRIIVSAHVITIVGIVQGIVLHSGTNEICLCSQILCMLRIAHTWRTSYEYTVARIT